MAKFHTNMQQKKKDLVSHDVPLPESAHEAIRDGFEPVIQIRFSPETMKKVNTITDSLLISRRISDPDTIDPNHPQVMMLATADKDRDVDDIIYEVQFYHKKWNREAQRDAGFIALTMLTKLKDVDPKPYRPEELQDDPEEEEEREDWEGQKSLLTPPDRILTHTYERRLKQFLDCLDLTDMMFQVKIGKMLKEIFISAVRNYGDGDVSEDNFQSSIPRGGTDSSIITLDGADNNAQGKRKKV